MPTSLLDCAKLLSQEGVRHHVDTHDGVVRVVFVTRHYENPRGEKLAIINLETPDDGRRCRASIARAFPVTGDPAVACLACCRLAADTPLVGVEYDADGEDLRLVVETVVEDSRLTSRQLLATIDRLIEAAEAWHIGMRATAGRSRAESGREKRGAA